MMRSSARQGQRLRHIPAIVALPLSMVLLFRPHLREPEERLMAATPARGAVLATAPQAVELTFASRPRRGTAHLAVATAKGERVDEGKTAIEGNRIRAQLPPLTDGWYLVAYHVALADGTESRGRYAFGVGQPAGPPPVTSRPAGHTGHGPPDPVTSALLAANVVLLVVLSARLAWLRRRRS